MSFSSSPERKDGKEEGEESLNLHFGKKRGGREKEKREEKEGLAVFGPGNGKRFWPLNGRRIKAESSFAAWGEK